MVIDTDKMREMLNGLDDKLFPNVDWDTCSMSFLNRREKFCVENMNTIDAIEQLHRYLSEIYSNQTTSET